MESWLSDGFVNVRETPLNGAVGYRSREAEEGLWFAWRPGEGRTCMTSRAEGRSGSGRRTETTFRPLSPFSFPRGFLPDEEGRHAASLRYLTSLITLASGDDASYRYGQSQSMLLSRSLQRSWCGRVAPQPCLSSSISTALLLPLASQSPLKTQQLS